MSRWSTLLFMIAALGIAPAVSAHDTCSVGNDRVQFSIDTNLERDGEDLVFERDDVEVARFTADDDLRIAGSHVSITPTDRRAIAAYRGAHNDLIESATAIGKEAARLGVSAALRAVASIFTGSSDEVEAEIEAEAADIEELAEALCDSVRDLREHHIALSEAVPEFGLAVPLKD